MTFASDATFALASFSGPAWFNGTTFTDEAWFVGTTFTKRRSFAKTTFAGTTSFVRATFSGSVSFDTSTFSGVAVFKETFSDDGKTDYTFFSPMSFEDARVSRLNDQDIQRSWPSGWIVRPDPLDPTQGTLTTTGRRPSGSGSERSA